MSLFEIDSGKRPANNYAVAVPVLKALGIDLAEETEQTELSTAAKAADDIDEPTSADGENAEPEAGRTPAAALPEAEGGSTDGRAQALKTLSLKLKLLELEV